MRELNWRITVVLFLALFGAPAYIGVAETNANTPLVLRKAAMPPIINGKTDDACWNNADWHPLRQSEGKRLAVGGSVALCYDGRNLYAAFRLDEPNPDKIRAVIAGAADAPPFWKGEVLELFLNIDPDEVAYFQLAWNPAGVPFSAKCRLTGPNAFEVDDSWKPEWKTAGEVGAKGWTSEAAIPFANLGIKTPHDGKQWRLNMLRTRQGDAPEYSALSPTGAGGGHTFDRFQDIYFGKYVEAKEEPIAVKRAGALAALIGCWDAQYGYAAIFDPQIQLDRALGRDNVQMRCGNMVNWPRRYAALAQFDLVVLTDVPAAWFTESQLHNLRRYVEEGGRVVLMGTMDGWLHDPKRPWNKSAAKDLLCLKITGADAIKPVEFSAKDHPLFRGLPAAKDTFTARCGTSILTTGAVALAAVPGGVFIAEKQLGQGRVIQISGFYAHCATTFPMSAAGKDFFMSRYYPLFWDNLVTYLTGRPVPNPAPTLASEEPVAKKPLALSFDILRDNHGDMFRSGGRMLIRPGLAGQADYPYEIEGFVETPDMPPISVGQYTLAAVSNELTLALPYLDRGAYSLRLDLKKGGAVIDSARGRFNVALSLIADDEFAFKVFFAPDYFGEPDIRRVAAELKGIGFTGIAWLGGELYGIYRNDGYRVWTEGRAVSRIQEAGLRVTPVWYAPLFGVMYSAAMYRLKPGEVNKFSGLPMPDFAFPGTNYLPWASFWLKAFANPMYGRMPLTDGYAAGDELVALGQPMTDQVKQGFTTMTGIPAPTNMYGQGIYRLIDYRLKVFADFIWYARSVSTAWNPAWAFNSSLTPSSFGGHSSCLIDVPDTASSLGATGPDEYWYGEPYFYLKSLSSMAIIWSATEFGRLARPEFVGGQLSNNYYEQFPEQVFGALSGGAESFTVFAFNTASFEKNGRQDPKFAEIARKTTAAAARIGRTLNHCERERARVAMVYPHTAHVWLSLDKEFNPDYLAMIGKSKQYLDLGYAIQLEFDLLRRMAGHVDVLFDQQIQRGDLKNYDVCVLAYAQQVEERTLRELKRFAEQGGTLLVTTDSGQLNEDNQPTTTLYDALPALVGAKRKVLADYSDTRMENPEPFQWGHNLAAKTGAQTLFTFVGNEAACVRGTVGRGEAVVLGMPLARLRKNDFAGKLEVIGEIINRRARLISKAADGEVSAITFTPKRGEGRIFMIANHKKVEVKTSVEAVGDESDGRCVLADLVTGEQVPFTVKDGKLTFEVTCPDRWGRALALLEKPPAAVEVSVSGAVKAGEKLLMAVRLLGKDGQPVRATLPFDLAVKDPEGKVREDLSGVRVAEQGVYVMALDWPLAAKAGQWSATAFEKISGRSGSIGWSAR